MVTNTVKQELLNDGELVTPKIADIAYPNSNASLPAAYTILAGAVDQEVDLSLMGDTRLYTEIDIPGASVGFLTFKVGTSTQSLPVGEKTVLTDNVSSLFFSNSNSTVYIVIRILPIYAL